VANQQRRTGLPWINPKRSHYSAHCAKLNLSVLKSMVKFYLVAGWLALALVAFVTLAPIYDRPTFGPPHLEHFAAFFVLSLMFMLAYPNRIVLVLLVVVGSAVTLEALQLLTPDRHGQLMDALAKVAGGLCGMTLTFLARMATAQTKTKIVPRG